MERIDNVVECIRNGRLDVRPDGRVPCKVRDIVKDGDRRTLDGNVDVVKSGVRDTLLPLPESQDT